MYGHETKFQQRSGNDVWIFQISFFLRKAACLPLPLSSFHGLEPECSSDEAILAIQIEHYPEEWLSNKMEGIRVMDDIE